MMSRSGCLGLLDVYRKVIICITLNDIVLNMQDIFATKHDNWVDEPWKDWPRSLRTYLRWTCRTYNHIHRLNMLTYSYYQLTKVINVYNVVFCVMLIVFCSISFYASHGDVSLFSNYLLKYPFGIFFYISFYLIKFTMKISI